MWSFFLISSMVLGFLINSRSAFHLRFFCISINLPYAHLWNNVVTSGLVALVATWNCKKICKNEYAGLLVLHLLLLLNLGSSSKSGQCKSFIQVLLWQVFSGTGSTCSTSLSLPVECFSLTYNLNGFKSRINRCY